MTRARGANAAQAAEREERIWQLRLDGLSLRQIGRELELAHQTVAEIIDRRIKSTKVPAVNARRIEAAARLEMLIGEAVQVLRRKHFAHSAGRVVTHPVTGEPVFDDGPRLAAIDVIRRLEERRAKLLGLDMPQEIDVEMRAADEIRRQADEALTEMVKQAREHKRAREHTEGEQT